MPLTALVGESACPRVGVESLCACAPITMSPPPGAGGERRRAGAGGERRGAEAAGGVGGEAFTSRLSRGITRMSCFVI